MSVLTGYQELYNIKCLYTGEECIINGVVFFLTPVANLFSIQADRGRSSAVSKGLKGMKPTYKSPREQIMSFNLTKMVPD